jgi:hydrophobe/amphiphile efflux-1 (HAE1) family protein
MNLTEVCIRKPVLAWMIMAATVLFGVVAGSRIGISQFPDVDFPTITIQLAWEGAAPEAMEHDVVDPIEEALVQVEGVRSMMSTSKQGGASITVELDLERDVDAALQDVQTRIAQTQQRLPRDLDPPVVSKTNPEDNPILWIGISGPYSRQFLADFARYTIKERLQTIPGVGEVTLGGYLERNVRIWVDAQKLDSYGVTVIDVIEALQKEHVELPAGRLEASGREINVRVMGEALDLAALRSIVIAKIGSSSIHLEDVALVEDGFEDVRRMARVNGQPAQGLGVRKQRGANAVAVAKAIKTMIADLQGSLPAGMELGLNFDSTRFIERSVREIQLELLLGVLLTALVCWLFLGSLSSTLNVVLAIPMSLLGTVAVIYFLGFTLNTFTLLALGLAVGIVVDDAIMVLENIVRHRDSGKDRVSAAREGTSEITFAALAATVAIVAIFLPVVFMEGIVGRFFLQFGITLSIAVLLSYLEAVTLAPARCAQMLRTSSEGRSRIGRWVDRAFEAFARAYGRLLQRALAWPYVVLGAAAVLLALAIHGFETLPGEFVPSQDQSQLMVRVQTAVGSNLAETDALMLKAEAVVNARKDVKRAFSIVGGFGGTGVNTSILFLTLHPPSERALTQAEVAQELRRSLGSIPGVRAVVQDLSQSGFTAQRGFPVELSVRGSDWNELVGVSDRLKQELTESGVLLDLDSDHQVGMPELRVVPDRAKAADLGVPMEAVASTLNALVGGVRVGKYSTNGRRIDVRLRLLATQRSRPEDLARLRVRTGRGDLIPLETLVTTDERPALQAITRRDRERAINMFANVAPGHSQEEAVRLVERLGKDLPIGHRVVLGGSSVAYKDTMSSLYFALILGILVAYMVLAAQFDSFLHPITVLTILPLSVAGAIAALHLTGRSLNLFSMIGLLLLMGIVKKNSIILVDYASQLQRSGKTALEAMREAGPVRLRPIVMTTVSTLMSALPPALALGAGSEIRAPMVIGVIGGLIVSTPLSLLVVPAFYVLGDRAIRAVRSVVPARESPAPQGWEGDA